MTDFDKEILEIIKKNKGIKARAIADKMGVERKTVNSALYGRLKKYCYQDSNYLWYILNSNETSKTDKQEKKVDIELSNLCNYYLNCLSLEENNGISLYLNGNYSEINNFDISQEINEDAISYLNKTSKKRNYISYIGYPISVETLYSPKKDAYFKVLVPVFLFPLEYNSGNVHISEYPNVNIEIVKKHSSNDTNNLIYDLIQLEEELGLNSSDLDIELDEIATRLQEIRKWNWKDKLDIDNLNSHIHFNDSIEDGIYNKAIVFSCERSPYTQGLESELSLLSQIDKDSYKETALYNWIHSERISSIEKNLENDTLLEVLPLNTEQREAVSKALTSDLTIVTGPPGTGKSQVVTEILLNSVWKNQNALFTSKNNKAVDVVDIRVNSLSNRPIMLRIGNNQYATRMAEIIEDLLSAVTTQTDKDDCIFYNNTYNGLVAEHNNLIKAKKEYINIRNKIDEEEKKIRFFLDSYNYLLCNITKEDTLKLEKFFDSFEKLYFDIQKYQSGIFNKIVWKFIKEKKIKVYQKTSEQLNQVISLYGFKNVDITQNDETIEENNKNIRRFLENCNLYLEYKKDLALFNKMETLESMDIKLYALQKKLSDVAEKLWDKWLAVRPIEITPKLRTEMIQYATAIKLLSSDELNNDVELKSQFSKMQKAMTKILPCWSITALSAKGKIPFQPAIYDLVIIDEASQCDIASILPLLYRAKKAVIIGDPKQLSHITSVSARQDKNLMDKFNIPYQWSYTLNSLFTVASSIVNANEIICLRDHHRCHEDIIDFSNKYFYDSSLRIATDYRKLKIPKSNSPGIRWRNIKGETVRPVSGGAYNSEEAKEIIEELKRLVIDNQYTGTIGIVTPFRAQSETIKKELEQNTELYNTLLCKHELLVDTVHKFQGDERDIIIFSPVISSKTQDGALQFLNKTKNLFNVAITRARAVLIVVGDIDFCGQCSVDYIKQFVRYVKELEGKISLKGENISYPENGEYPVVDNEEQVSAWEKLLYSALYKNGIHSFPQYPVDKYKLDLAIIQGDKKLDIEVDGEMYHRAWNGELCYRDQLRNHRMFELGWDVKRFWVYQLRDNLDDCVEQIKDWLEKTKSD